MILRLLAKHHLEFLSLKGGCTGSSESTLVKLPHCWKSHVKVHLYLNIKNIFLKCDCFSEFFKMRLLIYSKTCVKRPLSKRSKIGFRLMQVKSIAECSKGSILQYFRPSLNFHLSLRYLFCLFLSGCFTQVLLYLYFSLCFSVHLTNIQMSSTTYSHPQCSQKRVSST